MRLILLLNVNPQKISWNRNLKQDINVYKVHKYNQSGLVIGLYRPFCKNNLFSILIKTSMQCYIKIKKYFQHPLIKIL